MNNFNLITESDILPFLKKSFNEQDLFKSGSPDQKTLDESCRSDITFKELLDLVITDDQINYALEQSYQYCKTPYLVTELGIALLNRSNLLLHNKTNNPLEVQLTIEILGIDIPDNSKDEVELEMFIHSSSNRAEIFDLLIASHSCTIEDKKRLLDLWNDENYFYPTGQKEMELIDKVLDIDLEGNYHKNIKEIHYNLQYNESKQICRSKRVIYTMKHRLETKNFPFDSSRIELIFALSSNFDSTQIKLIQEYDYDSPNDSVFLPTTYFPRGFKTSCSQSKPECVNFYQSSGYYLQNLALLMIDLKRDSSSFILRTFVPASIVGLLAAFSALIYLFDNSLRDPILTQVIPSILVAEIVQQLTINQHIPTRSGRTFIDLFFVSLYISLTCYFVALSFTKIMWIFYTFLSLGSSLLLFSYIKTGRSIWLHLRNLDTK